MKKVFLPVILILLFSTLALSQIQPDYNLIPKPQSIKMLEGNFNLNSGTKILFSENCEDLAKYLTEQISDKYNLTLTSAKETGTSNVNNVIMLSLDNSGTYENDEGYLFTINSEAIKISAAEKNGLFYGIQTLFQILDFEKSKSKGMGYRNNYLLSSVSIKDYPKFQWRGLNLDCCRHFMEKEFVKRYIDLLAYHKMNVLHWHLTEDQGWRIEIKKYPELTKNSAWRKYDDGSVYGGYYTQEDIKEVVEYANSRFITVVPEIEMPGHSMAAISSYPQYSCTGGPFEVGTQWGIYKDVYCAGNDETFNFLQDVITEVVELFPSKYIHIGGDEVPKDRWQECPKCQTRIKSENLKDEHELQSYFIKRMEKFISSKGKRIIGWDEILEGGLAPAATVQSWRGVKGAIEAAKMGHDVIVSPTSHCYFDYPVETTDLEKVYSFDPVPEELSEQEAMHVLGSEANMWSEYAPQELIDDRLFPRILALSEVVWTYPSERNFDEFKSRVNAHYNRLDLYEVKYGLETKPISVGYSFDEQKNGFDVKIDKLQNSVDAFITINQNQPDYNSDKLSNSYFVSGTSDLEIGFFRDQKKVGKTYERGFTINKVFNIEPSLTYPYSDKYSAGGINALTDGIRGTDSYRDGLWQGYQGNDFETVLDLKSLTDISKISVGFFRASSSAVFFPEHVEFFISNDGDNFKLAGTEVNKFLIKDPDWIKHDFTASFHKTTARFVKVKAKNIGIIPEWHPVAGAKAWLMVDEIIIE